MKLLLLPARRQHVKAAGPGGPLVAEARGGYGEERHGPDAGQRSMMAAVLQGYSDGSWYPGASPRGGGIATAPPSNSHRSAWSPPSKMSSSGRGSGGVRRTRVSLP